MNKEHMEVKCSRLHCAVALLYFSGGGGTWMNSPFLRSDLNKPLGLGLADGKNDAIFTRSSQNQVKFNNRANILKANLIFVINVLADGKWPD